MGTESENKRNASLRQQTDAPEFVNQGWLQACRIIRCSVRSDPSRSVQVAAQIQGVLLRDLFVNSSVPPFHKTQP